MKKRTKSAIGRQNRAKGAAFERDVVASLREFHPEARRNLSQTRTARREGPDILGCPWWLELTCGRVSPSELEAKWTQAVKDRSTMWAGPSYETMPVVVVYRRSRQQARVLMHALTAGIADARRGMRVDFLFDEWVMLLRRRHASTVHVSPDPTEPFGVSHGG